VFNLCFISGQKIGQLISVYAVTLKLASEIKGGFQSCGDDCWRGIRLGRGVRGNGVWRTGVIPTRDPGNKVKARSEKVRGDFTEVKHVL
jgi:hypothetical protein